MTEAVLNLSGYQFAALSDLRRLRDDLLEVSGANDLRGTILLSHEGINLFVAGSRSACNALLTVIRSVPQIRDFAVKESIADRQPFNRMLVKIKKEIIAFGVNSINPSEYTSEHLPAAELKQWLGEDREVVLLDVRNTYESDLGSFDGAHRMKIDHFRDFPAKVTELPDEWKNKPVVTFCTGGIRCEKAAPYLEQAGFKDVYQLDGGILKYFEECGGEHYDGECFVFDQRVALNPQLDETQTTQCYACQAALTKEDQQSPEYELGKSCPHCYVPADQQFEARRQQRVKELHNVTDPLPGSIPYDNFRPINVPLKCNGMTVVEFLHTVHSHVSIEEWTQVCDSQRLIREDCPVAADAIVRAGDRYHHLFPANVEPEVAVDIDIVYEDDAIVVVNKPAPLPMHHCGRFNRNSLAYVLSQVYDPVVLRPAHRLDANTSGLVVFTCSKRFARLLQPQFEAAQVEKQYRVRVQGHPEQDLFVVDAPVSRDRQPGGLRKTECDGLPAQTEFEVLDRLSDGTSLLLASPKTGRTNQIRVHLWHLGTPVCGDPVYLPQHEFGELQTLAVDAPPMCLQAARLCFSHPATQSRVEFKIPHSEWFPFCVDSTQ